MRPEQILIGFIIIAVVVFSGISMINDLDESYDEINMSDTDDAFGDVYSDIEEISNATMDIKDDLMEVDTETGDTSETSWGSMITGGYSALRIIPKTFGLFQGITNAIGTTMGVECGTADEKKVCVIIDYAFLAFVLTVIFTIMYMIFRFIPK